MLWTIVAILLVLWLVGMISGAMGGIVHILLVLAAVAVVLSLLQGRARV
jgi:hypothetical protein